MKKLLTLLLTLYLTLCIGGILTSCGGNSDGGGDMVEVPPTTLDIAEETIEATQNVAFQVNARLAWKNWEWSSDTTPNSDIIWTLRAEDFVEPVNAEQIRMDSNESGDGWLSYYFTFEMVIERCGEYTLAATSRMNGELFDTAQITVLENQNQGDDGGENDGGGDENQSCAEENLQLELVGDHYVVTGLGTYELGSTGMGTYMSYPNSLIIINAPNGIPITEIADNAFAGNAQITHFESSTVTKIGDGAFENCTSLQGVYLQETTGPIEIGDSTFKGCESMEEILTTNIKLVGEYAFAGLERLDYASGVGLCFKYEPEATIGAHAFEGCTAFTCLEGGANDLVVGEYAFAGCSSISYENFTCAELGDYALSGTYLADVSFGLKTVKKYSFAGCDNLQRVSFTKKVEIVEANAFEGFTKLLTVNFQKGVDTISEYAFKNCQSLVTVSSGSDIGVIGERAFDNCRKMYLFTVEGSVGEVQKWAFSSCGAEVDVKYSLQGYKYLSYHVTGGTKILRNGAMNGAMLSELDLTKTELIEGDRLSFGGEVRLTLPSYYTEIPDGMFEGCSGLYGITFTSAVTKIGTRAFVGCNLSYDGFELPDSVTRIEAEAFRATSLTAVDLGKVTYIGEKAFYDCGNLSMVTLSSIAEILPYTFYNCKLDDAEFKIPDSVTKINEYAFANCSLTNGTLPITLTYIGDYAFAGKTNFVDTTVCLPAHLKEIGEGAFATTKVTKVVGGGLITNTGTSFVSMIFGKNVFQDCTALEEVDFTYWDNRNGVYSIGENMFDGCTALSKVTLGYVYYIGVGAFKDCTALTSFKVLPNNREGEYYENTATGFHLTANGQQTVRLTLDMLSNAEVMAANVKSGMYDSLAWHAWEL